MKLESSKLSKKLGVKPHCKSSYCYALWL